MTTILEITALLSLFVLLYIYIGYPVLLVLLRYILPSKRVKKKEYFPDVSLLISCFNEDKIIREKLENALAIDYPKAKLEIIVISDASTDNTDRIVCEYKDNGISLIRQEERKGKTSGLNLAVPKSRGDIIIFSDANAMFEPTSVQKLVRNFSDKNVGYVVGEARYKNKNQTMVFKTENTYWQYEIFMKEIESQVGSVVGGDGAIYGIRKELYEPLRDTDINDFVNPMQIILKGFRGVYEPQAVCWEESAGDFNQEFHRRIRIVNRSFSGLLRTKSVLNPFKTGFFSLEIISHKLLRWFTLIFVAAFAVPSLVLALLNFTLYQWVSILGILFFWCSYLGYLLSGSIRIWKLFYYPYYFVLINTAALLGVSKSLRGKIQTTWSHIREPETQTTNSYNWTQSIIHLLSIFSFGLFFKIIGDISGIPLFSEKVILWMGIFLLFYVYWGYPIILHFLAKRTNRLVQKKENFPSVTLLICAYNEEQIIEEKIKNSINLDYPPDKLRIVIASDGSTDRTNDIVEKYSNESLVLMDYPERRGKIDVINRTIPKLKSELVIFTDANTICEKDVIRKLVRNFNDKSVGAVSADVVLRNDQTTYGKTELLYYQYERWIQKNESDFNSAVGTDGGLYAIRTKLFVPTPPNIILDDFVISMNIAKNGHRVIFDEEAVAYEKSTLSYREEYLRKSRVVAGAIQCIMLKEGIPSIKLRRLFFCFVSHKYIRWMIPIILIVIFFTNIRLLSSGDILYSVTFLIQITFYLLAVLDLFIMRKMRFVVTAIPFYFCLVNCAALYGIYKGLFNKQPVKWQKFDR